MVNIWGEDGQNTFILAREGQVGFPMPNFVGFYIMCF
jgi:hypothetical protein